MSLEIRPLAEPDAEAALTLGREAFGGPPPDPGTTPPFPRPGTTAWGVLDGGRLLAKASGRHDLAWWHGTPVATCGVAGVAVHAEDRGRGLLADLLRHVLAEADEPVSTLFPTAPGIYRRLGWEVVGSLDYVDLPTAALAAVSPAAGATVRRAGPDDLDALAATYAAWARLRNGPLTRTSPCFPDGTAAVLTGATGVTLAEDQAGQAVGYARWRRGPGYGPDARIDVDELVATTPDAARALWRVLGSFASVTGVVRLRTSGQHPARLVLPTGAWHVVDTYPLMARVHPRALAGVDHREPVDLTVGVAGDGLGILDGTWRVAGPPGDVQCERVDGTAAATFTPQGLALAYAGALPSAQLRAAGHLRGDDHAVDDLVDTVLRRRTPAVLDYF